MLLLAVIIGIGLGFLTAAGRLGSDNLPATVVARVNGTDIQLGEYNRALRLFASEKRDPINNHDRKLVLERMVEEELLVQYGVATGLVRNDRGVRTAVLQTMLTGLMVEVDAREIASENPTTGMIKTTHDTQLREYLEQLREVATLRWTVADSGP